MPKSFRESGTHVSNDGLRYHMTADSFVAMFFATIALASSYADLSYVNMLPPPESPKLHCVFLNQLMVASCRVMVAGALEKHGRPNEAMKWASSELEVRPRGTCVLFSS